MDDPLLERVAETLDRIDRRQRRDDRLERREASFERSMRTVGREPRRVGFAMLARAVPGLAAQFEIPPAKLVPPEFWQLDGEQAVIACPCGAEPRIRPDGLTGCGCGRLFAFDGRQIRSRLGEPVEEDDQHDRDDDDQRGGQADDPAVQD